MSHIQNVHLKVLMYFISACEKLILFRINTYVCKSGYEVAQVPLDNLQLN